jgi:glutamate-1-semialdehyde 2,1-aminomutase
MILGHAHPAVIEAICKVSQNGTSFGAPTALEVEMAQMITDAVPSIEMIRMVNSGTEATMSAIRLARGFTGRDVIVKFDGCYHGHADMLLIQAGSGVATLGIPGSPGVPQAVVQHTVSLPFNDIQAIKQLMSERGKDIACIIVEPVVGNAGCIPPIPGFLETLREETKKHGSLLIFDEVMTGFRLAFGGAQELYKIMPDLTCLGKIIGGGLPVGAYGGRRDIMEYIAPKGPVYQAGTLSGNPVAMAAGIAMLKELKKPGFYEDLEQKSRKLDEGLKRAAKNAGIEASFNRVGSMSSMFFTDRKVNSFDDAKTSDLKRFTAYYAGMLEKGVYLAPSQFEAGFVSSAHGDAEIGQTIVAAEAVLKSLT